MKQRRKPHVPRKAHSETQITAKKENPKSQNPIEVPAGEDEISFDRHNRLLAIEFTKRKRNEGIDEYNLKAFPL